MSAIHQYRKPPAHHFTESQRPNPDRPLGRPTLLTEERKQLLLSLRDPVETAILRRLAGKWHVSTETVRGWRKRLKQERAARAGGTA